MNSVLNALQPKAHVGSNGFDVSHRDVFSTKPGICLPAFYRHVPYKSTFRVDIANIIETTTLQTNAFARGSFNLDMYFVPYSQLFRHSDEIILGRGQHNRRMTNPDVDMSNPLSMPTFPLSSVLIYLFQEWIIDKSYDGHTISGRKSFVDVFGNNAAEDALRLLDLLGYGNFLPVFKSMIYDLQPISSDLDNISYMSQTFNSSSVTVRAIYSQVFGRELTDEEVENIRDITIGQALIMLCGTSSWTLTDQEGQSVWSETPKQYNILAIAAYQKVWSDMFRNFIYDTEDYTDCFNFDWLLTSNVSTDVSVSYNGIDVFVNRVFMPRYRQWKKDLFTGTYPSAQFGDVAFQQVSDGTLNVVDLPVDSNRVDVDSDGFIRTNGRDEDYIDGAKFRFNGVGISALDIRYTMAMQRYRERLLRSGNRTKDVLQAQFGVSSRYIEDDYVDFLGTYSGTLNINKVAGTTNEGDTSIGELGAYGNASINGARIERQFNDYGIIIGMLTFVPETEYDAYMVDPFNTKTEKMDYAQPDFENLGLSPVFGFELDQRLGNMVLGYTARYHEYKMSIDKVHGEFHGIWRPIIKEHSEDYEGYPRSNPARQGVFSDYVTPRDSYYMTSNNWLARYYINPSCMDSIFLKAVGDSQDTDPFKIDMNYIVNSVQPLSVTGLPEL